VFEHSNRDVLFQFQSTLPAPGATAQTITF